MFEWLIEGLLIIRKYTTDASMVAEHDQLWIAEGLRMEEEDEVKMFQMGWLWDDSVGAWLYIL